MNKSNEIKENEIKVIKEFSKMCSQSLPPEIYETSQRIISALNKNRNLKVK